MHQSLSNDRTAVPSLFVSNCAYSLGTPANGPDERGEWLVGADSANVFRTATVRSEARIDRIVLPKVGEREGGLSTRYRHFVLLGF